MSNILDVPSLRKLELALQGLAVGGPGPTSAAYQILSSYGAQYVSENRWRVPLEDGSVASVAYTPQAFIIRIESPDLVHYAFPSPWVYYPDTVVTFIEGDGSNSRATTSIKAEWWYNPAERIELFHTKDDPKKPDLSNVYGTSNNEGYTTYGSLANPSLEAAIRYAMQRGWLKSAPTLRTITVHNAREVVERVVGKKLNAAQQRKLAGAIALGAQVEPMPRSPNDAPTGRTNRVLLRRVLLAAEALGAPTVVLKAAGPATIELVATADRAQLSTLMLPGEPPREPFVVSTSVALEETRKGKEQFHLSNLVAMPTRPPPELDLGNDLSSTWLAHATHQGHPIAAWAAKGMAAVSPDPARFGLNAVHIETVEDGHRLPAALRLVSTDGHWLSYADLPLANITKSMKRPMHAMLPANFTAAIAQLEGWRPPMVGVRSCELGLEIRMDGTTTARTLWVDGSFPDYRAILNEVERYRTTSDTGRIVLTKEALKPLKELVKPTFRLTWAIELTMPSDSNGQPWRAKAVAAPTSRALRTAAGKRDHAQEVAAIEKIPAYWRDGFALPGSTIERWGTTYQIHVDPRILIKMLETATGPLTLYVYRDLSPIGFDGGLNGAFMPKRKD